MTDRRTSRIAVWWQAIRYHYIPPSIFPAALGGIVSWSLNNEFSVWYFLLVLVGVIINHAAVNMTDDYFDYKHAVDHLSTGQENPYTGGSRTLSSGLIKPSSMFRAFTLCYMITAMIGIYLTAMKGLPVLAFGIFGVFCSIFYTGPPVSFSHRGFGELGLLVNFGTTIGLGSYFVQAQALSIGAFMATLPCGIMLFSMIVINEIPDFAEDRQAGKLTLVARYGKPAGVKLYMFSWLCTYSVVVGSVFFGMMPLLSLLILASVPAVYRSIVTLRAKYDNPAELAPANLDMIRAHVMASLGLIIAYSVVGLLNGSDLTQLAWFWILLLVFYIPAAFTVFLTGRKRPKP